MTIDNVAEKDLQGESAGKGKPRGKRPALLAVLRGLFAILVCLAECALVLYWINGLVFCEGERMDILVAFQYILRIFGIRIGNLYPYLSGLVIAIVYIAQTVLLAKNVFMAFLCTKKVASEMGSTNKLGSAEAIKAFRALQTSFHYAILMVVSFVLVASVFVKCRLPQETVLVFAIAIAVKLLFPFFLRPLPKKKIVGELLNLFGTALLFFACVFVVLWSVGPWVQSMWEGVVAIIAGALAAVEYQSLVPFLFFYFVQPVFMLILIVKAYQLLKALFNSLELSENKAIFAYAKSLLILLFTLAIVAWAVAEAASGFSGAGTGNLFLRCYQATSDYHLPILCAAACVTAYYFPWKDNKEKAII